MRLIIQTCTHLLNPMTDVQGCPMSVSDRTWERLVEVEVGNRDHRLFGGSQYHRTMREFQLAARCLRIAAVEEEEIANAAGLGETHDGVNFLHAACTIALDKARVSFEPMLRALETRMTHVMERLCPIAEYMLRENRERTGLDAFQPSKNGELEQETSIGQAMDISQNPQFRQLVRSIFEKFVRQCAETVSPSFVAEQCLPNKSNSSLQAMLKCRDDLTALTRYVSWNLAFGGNGGISRALPDHNEMISVYQMALKSKNKDEPNEKAAGKSEKSGGGGKSKALTEQQPLTPMTDNRKHVDQDFQNLLQLMEEAVMSRNSNRTSIVVGGLVQHIVSGWQDQFCRSVTTKFNCFFMLPFADEFHRYIRNELQQIYEGDGDSLTDVFDLRAARRSLQMLREDLNNECMANKRLQEKFRVCSQLIQSDTKRPRAFVENNGF
jgi:hypothetical protein